jgi:hypothetical protein
MRRLRAGEVRARMTLEAAQPAHASSGVVDWAADLLRDR